MPEHLWFQPPPFHHEGYLTYSHDGRFHKIWYGQAGQDSAKPLALIIHGGPGGCHRNMIPFARLSDARRMVFYDQLGCGRSDRPSNPALWTVERYTEELGFIVQSLAEEAPVHFIAHGWGTVLAVSCAFLNPSSVASLSLHSPVLSYQHFHSAVGSSIREALPNDAGKTLERCEREGHGGSDYEKALQVLLRNRIVRTWPPPDCLIDTICGRNEAIHDLMIGSPSDTQVTGTLRHFDISSSLQTLQQPILITSGESDLYPPDFAMWHYLKAPGKISMHTIANAAHMTMIDQPGELLPIQSDFLNESDPE